MASPKTRQTATAKKIAATKAHAVKKPAAKKLPARKAARVKPAKNVKSAKKPAPTRKTPARRKSSGFGRVRVPVDARLDLVFQKDYQAREVFDFLKVQTIRELEQFGPAEILDRLTGPMQQTVLRIRKTLALVNRHLARDEKFAKDFLLEVSPTSVKRRTSQK
jgi:hypothetical protein